MLLWICFAVLTALVVAVLMQPLRRGRSELVDPGAADRDVYRAQLTELEAERERGLVDVTEFEGARAEVARRLLKAAEADDNDGEHATHTGASPHTQMLYMVVAAIIPLAAVTTYVLTGSPHLPSKPFAARKAEPVATRTPEEIIKAISLVEERLRAEPNDGQGWAVIAPIYLRLGRFGDAAHAFAEANRLLGETPKGLLGFAEATLRSENGQVTEPVRRAARRVLELQPDRVTPRVWLALGLEQDKNFLGAVKIYEELLARAPAEAKYRKAVADRLSAVRQKINGGSAVPEKNPPSENVPAKSDSANEAESTGPRNPTAQEIARAQQMTPEAREAFVTDMVSRLADRLKKNGQDLQGWLRLARAYHVLGREDDATGAIESAKKAFANDPTALETIEKAATELADTASRR